MIPSVCRTGIGGGAGRLAGVSALDGMVKPGYPRPLFPNRTRGQRARALGLRSGWGGGGSGRAAMGQPIAVTEKHAPKPGVVRYELTRSLTGMAHERYGSAADAVGDRPPD